MLLAATSGMGQTTITPSPTDQTDAAREPSQHAQSEFDFNQKSLEEWKVEGALRSALRNLDQVPLATSIPETRLGEFKRDIEPILSRSCVKCHGSEVQEGNIRIDNLDPDVVNGADVNWWFEVLGVLSNGEMPPADDGEMPDADRAEVVEWLSSEIQLASALRRDEKGHSSFRRMTRYEYNYALQDLLGLPYDFAQDLPPEPISEDGFQNSSEMLQMSTTQLECYRNESREALKKAVVRGERPLPVRWAISMERASEKRRAGRIRDLERIKERNQEDPDQLARELNRHAEEGLVKPAGTYFKDLTTGQMVKAKWSYNKARYAWKPTKDPDVPPVSQHVAVIPAGQRLIVELGNSVPDTGMMHVRIRAAKTVVEEQDADRVGIEPTLSLEFGWQASNNSAAAVRIADSEVAINAASDSPQFYQWDIPLSEIYPRNPMRETSPMGQTPSPSEFMRLHNTSLSKSDLQIDYVEVTAPVYDHWPPRSHTRIFVDSTNQADQAAYAREVLTGFMSRAWRRPVTEAEVDQKLDLLERVEPSSDDFQSAMTEVLVSVLASPKFLYLRRGESGPPSDRSGFSDDESPPRVSDIELATRLSMFLWCSVPDEELMELARRGKLSGTDVLLAQVNRMLADSRSRRFSKHFVRQWLGMQQLDFLNVDQKVYRQFDSSLKEAMQREPVAFFEHVLRDNGSVLDFIHADYAIVNERLARHYGLPGIFGSHFRRVSLRPEDRRGGLMTQAGILAMNSDGKDSHPLKRGIWILESLLNDPPPPPPPAVPEIDLADPEIAKMTLKQRMEDHRNHAACMSCHSKIDPWGIAFENYDAIGSWRTEINGNPVDASSVLFNRQKLNGIDGLKRYLLMNRQDQFARALVHKMTTYALGRPLRFGDRSGVDRITSELRKQGDGLGTLVTLVVTSELFKTR